MPLQARIAGLVAFACGERVLALDPRLHQCDLALDAAGGAGHRFQQTECEGAIHIAIGQRGAQGMHARAVWIGATAAAGLGGRQILSGR
jgi:hypothetical protein